MFDKVRIISDVIICYKVFFFVKEMKKMEFIGFDEFVMRLFFDVKERFKDVCRRVIDVFVNEVFKMVDCILVM